VLLFFFLRYLPELTERPLLGGFFKGGVCATASWLGEDKKRRKRSLSVHCSVFDVVVYCNVRYVVVVG
jgi:hypothetical protein